MILAKAFGRRADGADDASPQILFAPHPIVDLIGERVEEQAVHREVTARCIGLGIGENHALRPAAVTIFRLGPKGGHLKLAPLLDHHDHPEFSADGNGFGKEFFHLRRRGVGGNVKIFRFRPSKKSRTQPPTQKAAKPAPCRCWTILCAPAPGQTASGCDL